MIDEQTASIDTVIQTNQHFAFIIGIHPQKDSTVIDVDYIQYLTGQTAIEAAAKVHEADSFKTADGKFSATIPNDYFILNENTRIRSLALAKNCVFDLIINPDRTPPVTDNSLSSFMKAYKDNPFRLSLSNDNKVLSIKEIFVP